MGYGVKKMLQLGSFSSFKEKEIKKKEEGGEMYAYQLYEKGSLTLDQNPFFMWK